MLVGGGGVLVGGGGMLVGGGGMVCLLAAAKPRGVNSAGMFCLGGGGVL